MRSENWVGERSGNSARRTLVQAQADLPEGSQVGELINNNGAPVPGASVEKIPGSVAVQWSNGAPRLAKAGLQETPAGATGSAPEAEVSTGELEANRLGSVSVEVKIGLFGDLPAPAPLVRRGRPTALTPEIRERLCMLLSLGLSRRQAAAYVDLDHSTISRAASRDAELARTLHRAEEISSVQPLLTVLAASRKHWRAAAWLLSHKAKYPPALTAEDREEKHQEAVAEGKRMMEYFDACHAHERELEQRRRNSS